MFIKLISSLILGAGLVLAMPPIPELPMADTGAADDTGAVVDTGAATDTDTGDTGDTDDTGDTGDTDTGSINTEPTEAATTYSASQLAGEKGGGCSTSGALSGPWFIALLGLLIGRRRE